MTGFSANNNTVDFDIPIPTIPGLPSFEFPPFPDVPTDLINLKARFDSLDELQGQTPSVSLESGGTLSYDPTSGGGGGGGGREEPRSGGIGA